MKITDDVTKAYTDFAKENIHKVSLFKKKDGSEASFKPKRDAEESIARSGFRGTAIALPLKRGHNINVQSPSEAQRRGVWDGDSDKRISIVSAKDSAPLRPEWRDVYFMFQGNNASIFSSVSAAAMCCNTWCR